MEDSVFAIPDKYPVTQGHVLIVPRRHTQDYFTMSSQEHRDAEGLLARLRNLIAESDPTVVGFNIDINCGEAAGQTI
jgi:diadenosine tetraphosphate (Ap4A) HIT family hydrolase